MNPLGTQKIVWVLLIWAVLGTSGLLYAVTELWSTAPGVGVGTDGGEKSVRVDPASQTVRVDADCTSGDVDHATHPLRLAVPFGIVATTGVAGLTLGGGTGYLTRKYGLTIDNLLEADVGNWLVL